VHPVVVCLAMVVHPAVAVPRLRIGVVATVAMVLDDPTMAMVVIVMGMAMVMMMMGMVMVMMGRVIHSNKNKK
jgi:hypothetical protein